ncbi:uncharacterized protein LY79DRAFT_656446 [Colletotrichum navitas]|uniref:Uncharacterized protein n=1 Tax=Colletotrichum navitas TaxID=681940 RepID=A0AAD8QA77_9PEZI|nr:uncharacterized protein LY79DRAFT_656446 [Colletotrichum navitas]KAK1597703.1 hypothetical protein LY79DRAFT_656446 [Colletotrichum navitas]
MLFLLCRSWLFLCVFVAPPPHIPVVWTLLQAPPVPVGGDNRLREIRGTHRARTWMVCWRCVLMTGDYPGLPRLCQLDDAPDLLSRADSIRTDGCQTATIWRNEQSQADSFGLPPTHPPTPQRQLQVGRNYCTQVPCSPQKNGNNGGRDAGERGPDGSRPLADYYMAFSSASAAGFLLLVFSLVLGSADLLLSATSLDASLYLTLGRM